MAYTNIFLKYVLGAALLIVLGLGACQMPPVQTMPLPTPPSQTLPVQTSTSSLWTSLAFETIILDGAHSAGSTNISEPNVIWIDNQENAEQIKEQVSVEAFQELIELDFDQYFALAAFRGREPTSGFDIIIEQILKQDSRLVVNAQFWEPRPGWTVLDMATSPYHIVKIHRQSDLSQNLELLLQTQAVTPTPPSSHSSLPTTNLTPPQPATTDTSNLPPEKIMRVQPVEIAPEPQREITTEDALVFCDDQPYLMFFNPQIHTEPFDIGDVTCLSTSPDGKWLAYIQESSASSTGYWLVIESADHHQRKIVMDTHLRYFGENQWLDNQRLIFPLFREVLELRPMVVLDPFTEESIELASDYPGMTFSIMGPGETLHFIGASVVYHPSLDYVIYPQGSGSQHPYIVLRDRRSGFELAKVEDQGEFGHLPLWAPDGNEFAVAVNEISMRWGEEWYSLSLDGVVKRITHFSDFYEKAIIGEANWSPDGAKIAFWLDTQPNFCPQPGYHLAVLEKITQQVTNTCIPGSAVSSPKPPLWSLDSRYLILTNPDAGALFILDGALGWASLFPLNTNVVPAGWLASP